MQRSSTQSDRLQVICPLQDVTGEKVDISDYLDFGFHDNVSYKDNAGLVVISIVCLWVSHRVIGTMPYCILKKGGHWSQEQQYKDSPT